MLGRGWGMFAEAELSITMYVVWHLLRLEIVPQPVIFPLSSLSCIEGSCECVYDVQEAAFGLLSSAQVFLG